MKVLYIATSFPPPHKGATIYTDLAEALHSAGHQIAVAVAEEPKNLKTTTLGVERGIEVLRAVTGNQYDCSTLERGITSLKMPHKLKSAVKAHFGSREFDLILLEAPPVTNYPLIKWAKKHFKAKVYLMQKDIFAQDLVDLEVVSKFNPVYLFYRLNEILLYSVCDMVGCMSHANIAYMNKYNRNLPLHKLELFPNTKKIKPLYPVLQFTMREKLNIPVGAKVFMMGGAIGPSQYPEFLCDMLKKIKMREDIYIVFIGRGTDMYKIKMTIEAENIKNALALDNLPRDEYEQILKECDAGIVVLNKKFTTPNFPSRILSYMEFAKPVVSATNKESDFDIMINENGLGIGVYSDDIKAFTDGILALAASDRINEMGQNARRYIEDHFDVMKSVKILEDFINKY